jgi:hypothetical protein
LNVSLGAVVANLGLLGVLFAAKMVPKLAMILPLARRHVPEHATFITLLMSTGLTFGTISSLLVGVLLLLCDGRQTPRIVVTNSRTRG